MKVFMLGGYGAIGLPCAELLAESGLVSEIALAGRNKERAEVAAKELGDKARAVQVDGSDQEQLALCLAGYDIIVNTVSNDVALPALHAAMRTGAHYCDVGWGWDFVTQVMEHNAEAEQAGITAVICTGISPCLTNLMGVHAAGQLDEVVQLQAGRAWVYKFESGLTLMPQQWFEDPTESLAFLQEFKDFLEWMFQIAQQAESRLVRAYQNGRWLDVDPQTSGIQVPNPKGGTVTAFPFGSYDPLFGNQPNDLASARPVELLFTPFPLQLHELYRQHVLRVAAGDDDPGGALSSFFETIASDPDRWLTIKDDFVVLPPDWVSAVGHKGGRAVRYTCWMVPETWSNQAAWFLTSVPLAVTVLSILRGQVQAKGVMTAEKTFSPLPFFDEVVAMMPDPPPQGKLIGESFEWLA